MRRLASCLGQLPRRERTVLELRAGIGPRQPVSRDAVGRRLEVREARVARIERRGLRRLRALGRGGGCGVGPGEVVAVLPANADVDVTAHPLATAAATAPGARDEKNAPDPDSGVKGAFDSSTDGRPATIAPPIPRDESADLSIFALLLGVVLFGIAIRRELRARAT